MPSKPTWPAAPRVRAIERRGARQALALGIALWPLAAPGIDYSLHGLVDLRLVAPADETSWTAGGLGKTRFGGGDDVDLAFGSAALAATLQPAPEWLLLADLELHTTDRDTLQLLQGYARYRPVSTSPWRWSLRGGAFFPPISLENEGLGWTSLWTITPSAINGWVGEELRTIGGEFRLERRGTAHTFEGGAALFGHNDPAGELLAARGWALSDLVYGFGGRAREPDVYAADLGKPAPLRFDPFQEIDDRLGWHADLTWRSPAYGRVTLLRYDNNADPATFVEEAGGRLFTWHTWFWSLAAETHFGGLVLAAQAIDGATVITPNPRITIETRFGAGYLLAAWTLGRWQPALRFDMFSTHDFPETLRSRVAEHGNAMTAALNWRPRDSLRLIAEVLRVDSWRNQRLDAGLPPRSVDTQVQLAARWLF